MTVEKMPIGDFFKKNNKKFEDSTMFKTLNMAGVLPSENVFVAGGSVRKTIMGENIGDSDIDLFFKNKHAFQKTYHTLKKSRNLIKHFKHVEMVRNFQFDIRTDAQKTAYISEQEHIRPRNHFYGYIKSDNDPYVEGNYAEVQTINFRYFPSVESLIDGFDFTVSQFGIDDKYVYFGSRSLADVIFKKLYFNSTKNKFSIVNKRWAKHLDLGFKPTPEASQTYKELVEWCRENWKENTVHENDYINV